MTISGDSCQVDPGQENNSRKCAFCVCMFIKMANSRVDLWPERLDNRQPHIAALATKCPWYRPTCQVSGVDFERGATGPAFGALHVAGQFALLPGQV